MKHVIPLGTTEPQDFELRDDSSELMVPINGTGLTVSLEIKKRVGAEMVAVDTPPTVTWLSQPTGTVRVTGAGSLTVGNYFVRYKLADGSGNVGYCPNTEKADHWQVVGIATA